MTWPADEHVGLRTEQEVAADTVWALIEAGLLARKVSDVARALAAVGISRDDLRLASIRWERRRWSGPRDRLTRTAKRSDPAQERCPALTTPLPHPAEPEPEPVPPAPARPNLSLVPQPEPETDRTCRRCRKTKPIGDFPVKKGRIKTWCRSCSVGASERVVQQRRSWQNAYLAVVLANGDECVGMDCEVCSTPLRVGDTMVVHGRPRHDKCPS